MKKPEYLNIDETKDFLDTELRKLFEKCNKKRVHPAAVSFALVQVATSNALARSIVEHEGMRTIYSAIDVGIKAFREHQLNTETEEHRDE